MPPSLTWQRLSLELSLSNQSWWKVRGTHTHTHFLYLSGSCVILYTFSVFLSPSELSDEYQTDYDEEAIESALSDFDMSNPNSGAEHTEGEETADTVCTRLKSKWPPIPIWDAHIYPLKQDPGLPLGKLC